MIYGLIFLFLEPNPNDPLNHEAAEVYRTNIEKFKRTVTETLQGRAYQGRAYEKFI